MLILCVWVCSTMNFPFNLTWPWIIIRVKFHLKVDEVANELVAPSRLIDVDISRATTHMEFFATSLYLYLENEWMKKFYCLRVLENFEDLITKSLIVGFCQVRAENQFLNYSINFFPSLFHHSNSFTATPARPTYKTNLVWMRRWMPAWELPLTFSIRMGGRCVTIPFDAAPPSK